MAEIYENYPQLNASEEEREKWVQRVQWTAMKTRSNTSESLGLTPEQLAADGIFDKYLFDDNHPLNIINMTEAMLANGRKPSVSDVQNVKAIVLKSDTLQGVLSMIDALDGVHS